MQNTQGIVKRPIITEKATMASEQMNRFTFEVIQTANKIEIKKSKAYLHGLGMSLLNTFAIPFYFTTISFLIGLNYFDYSLYNAFYFSIGSTLGSFTTYSVYAIVANKIEHKLTNVAQKMDLILAVLTGGVAIVNLILLLEFKS